MCWKVSEPDLPNSSRMPRVPHPRFAGRSGHGARGDAILQFDWAVGAILSQLDSLQLRENTLVILSADHGAPEHPGYLATLGIEADTFDFDRIDTQSGFARLQETFGVGRELIASFSNPYLYLDQALIEKRGLDPAAVESALAAVKATAEGTDNLLYSMKDALRADATLGEISDALREVFGVYTP